MANYYANCRTNYFKVKDNDAFELAMAPIPDIEVIITPGTMEYCILGNNEDGRGWPVWIQGVESDTEIEIDLPNMVAEHLQDGEVAIFMEVGNEKLRYLNGYATAINNKGERRDIGLNDIYDIAKELTNKPEPISMASY